MCDHPARNSLSLGYESESEGGGISPSNSNQSDDSPQRGFGIENNKPFQQFNGSPGSHDSSSDSDIVEVSEKVNNSSSSKPVVILH